MIFCQVQGVFEIFLFGLCYMYTGLVKKRTSGNTSKTEVFLRTHISQNGIGVEEWQYRQTSENTHIGRKKEKIIFEHGALFLRPLKSGSFFQHFRKAPGCFFLLSCLVGHARHLRRVKFFDKIETPRAKVCHCTS